MHLSVLRSLQTAVLMPAHITETADEESYAVSYQIIVKPVKITGIPGICILKEYYETHLYLCLNHLHAHCKKPQKTAENYIIIIKLRNLQPQKHKPAVSNFVNQLFYFFYKLSNFYDTIIAIYRREDIIMALIQCPECGASVSDKANACIQCGNPIGVGQIQLIRRHKAIGETFDWTVYKNGGLFGKLVDNSNISIPTDMDFELTVKAMSPLAKMFGTGLSGTITITKGYVGTIEVSVSSNSVWFAEIKDTYFNPL